MKDMTVDESSDKKKQKRGGKAAVKAKKKVEPGDVKVGRVSRGKKKSVTHITGLMTYEIDLKKTAKLFGGKFACGTSSNEKADEIVIQGTVFITYRADHVKSDSFSNQTATYHSKKLGRATGTRLQCRTAICGLRIVFRI